MQSRRMGVWKRRMLRNLNLYKNQPSTLLAPDRYDYSVGYFLANQNFISSRFCWGWMKNTSGIDKFIIKEP